MDEFVEGKNYKLSIIHQDHYGRGIAKFNRYPIFIPYTLPGELIEVKITKSKKNFAEGLPEKLITVSNNRVKIPCENFYVCGGCDIMHQKYEDGLKMKKRNLLEILYKFGKIDVTKLKINNVVKCDDIFNYRNKVTFHVKDNKIGFYKNETNELINIDECKIINDKFNKILKYIKKHLSDSGITEIVMRYGTYTDELMIIFKSNKNIDEQFIRNLVKLNKSVKSIYLLKNSKYKLIYGEKYIHENLLDKTFRISPDSFFQVNTKQAEKMFSKVLKYINSDDKNILDLYCGIGVISLIINNSRKNIIGVDIVKNAIEDANVNKVLNNASKVEFVCENVSNILPVIKRAKKDLDVIILDPPRTGIDKNSVNIINELLPKKLIYISCNPVTLARDLKTLKENYNVEEITPYDMFPITHHIETVTLLTIKEN
ncbi:MAG: 23S rRNA (uracil(1939)-C(5))-methyltransferase RlmD [Bacilli bacterium]|nr:23S rRNA (uracil(1939)-C(5))-methyltransferase RlmD [Bacilli bacterium]